MQEAKSEFETKVESQIRHMRHPVKMGLLTIAGNEDCNIPELTAEFLFGGVNIDPSKVLDRD